MHTKNDKTHVGNGLNF